MAFVDDIILFVNQEIKEKQSVRYLQSYIALGRPNGSDYAWFSPRLTEGMCYIMILSDDTQIEDAISELNKKWYYGVDLCGQHN